VSRYTFLDPDNIYPLPRSFDFPAYIEAEQEFWALFPETEGLRVNFCQLGLTAQLYIESSGQEKELAPDETYFLMPCPDRTMRPLRMKAFRRLTLLEYRLSHITARKMLDHLRGTSIILAAVDREVLGSSSED
jgi:hypothetical protein